MNLDYTRHLIDKGFRASDPKAMLIQVLDSVMELISIPDNDFSWSSWESAEVAINEIENLIDRTKIGYIPNRLDITIIFAPTGPLQELSLSSGWADTFLKIAERFDEVEFKLWKKG